MDKQDWSEAPKDAQFYSCGDFRKHVEGKEYFWDNKGFWCGVGYASLDSQKEVRYDFEMRPEEPVWDGKSVLKAGDKAMTAGGECIVLGIDLSKGQAAVQWLNNGELGVILIGCIMPIITDRDKWVNEAQKHCTEFVGNQLGYIYDAMKDGKLEKP